VTLTVNDISVSPPWDNFWTEGCPYNRVDVRDGNDAEAPLIGSYCGSKAPPHLTSQGSAMFVQVTLVYVEETLTFAASYSVLSSGKCQHTNSQFLNTEHTLHFAELFVSYIEKYIFLIHTPKLFVA
jgi:hypothetical protein